MPNVYLTGMMGSGKTVTGKKLAALLGCRFADLDELIEERARRSVAEIFEKEGEHFFRQVESDLLKEVSGVSPRVVATGGGTVLRPENVLRMRQTGKVVYLETSLEVLWQRVRGKEDRPLLKSGDPRENLRRIYDARRPLYEESSDLRVSTDGQTAKAVAEAILRRLEENAAHPG